MTKLQFVDKNLVWRNCSGHNVAMELIQFINISCGIFTTQICGRMSFDLPEMSSTFSGLNVELLLVDEKDEKQELRQSAVSSSLLVLI